MTHTLHRSGSEESLRNDFVVFAMAAQTVNAKGIAPEFKVFESIVKKYNPVNYGDMKTGNVFMVDLGDIGKSYCDSSIAHAVFTDEVTVGKVLNELDNLPLSVISTTRPFEMPISHSKIPSCSTRLQRVIARSNM
jgi:hypothetical protein